MEKIGIYQDNYNDLSIGAKDNINIYKRNFTIKDLPMDDRPQEKLIKFGPEYLSNAELLALIIRTGSKTKTSIELAQEILYDLKLTEDKNQESLSVLNRASINSLMKINGVGQAKAAMIMAVVTLANRINSQSIFEKKKISSPKDLIPYVMDEMKSLGEEHFKIVILNTKKEIEYVRTISKGIIDATVVHPREVFKTAIDCRAHTIILLHNHPSGDPSPSKEDINLTKRLVESGKIIGIRVIDHIIIGDRKYCSFLEQGLI